MALSPGIPTSFVPRQPTPAQRRIRTGTNLFLLLSLFVLCIAVVATIGTFAYDRYLRHALGVKSEELARAQASVDQEQVEAFVRLRDRLTYGESLLEGHVALSQLFSVLERETLGTVRYESLNLTIAEDKSARLEIEGVARTFNALAAQSNAFAGEKYIRRAIFSGIVVNQDASVSFFLTADLDPRLVVASPEGLGPPAELPQVDVVPVPVFSPQATGTATTTP